MFRCYLFLILLTGAAVLLQGDHGGVCGFGRDKAVRGPAIARHRPRPAPDVASLHIVRGRGGEWCAGIVKLQVLLLKMQCRYLDTLIIDLKSCSV